MVSMMTPGRNDPCPCGSGKKYKKCHAQWGSLYISPGSEDDAIGVTADKPKPPKAGSGSAAAKLDFDSE